MFVYIPGYPPFAPEAEANTALVPGGADAYTFRNESLLPNRKKVTMAYTGRDEL